MADPQAAVTDTHALVFHAAGGGKLGPGAAAFFAEIPASHLSAAAAHLDAVAQSALGLRAGWVMARASVAARAGERATVERLLEERGALLGVGARALLRAAISDLRAGRAVEVLTVDPTFGSPTLRLDAGEEPLATELVPTSATGALSCLDAASSHRHEHLRRCLDVAANALDLMWQGTRAFLGY